MEDKPVGTAYDKWFCEQVEMGLAEADDLATVWLSNEEVKARSTERRAEWMKCAGQQVTGTDV